MSVAKTKVAILIDHSNLRHTYLGSPFLKSKGKLDYRKLINSISTTNEDLVGKIIFLNRELAGQALCMIFAQKGFETIEKGTKTIRQKDGTDKLKCNLDVEISIVAMQMVFDRVLYPVKPEKIIIVAGDSDFEMLGQTLIDYGIKVEFVFFSSNFAKELRQNFSSRLIDQMPVWSEYET